MKQYFVLIALFLTFSFPGHAAFHLVNPALPKTQAEKIASRNLRIQEMKYYCSLSLKEYENLQGKKLNYLQKRLFKSSQHRMKGMLKGYEKGDVSTLQKINWVLKGILLGPLAILLAYLFLKDEERELIKFAWIGFAGFVALWVTVLLVVGV